MIEAIFCLIFGGIILIKGFLVLWDDIKSKNYPSVQAAFQKADVVKNDSGDYEVKLSYEYNFAGKTYNYCETAKSWTGDVGIWFLTSAQERANSFIEKNEPIYLYVNPDKPHKARNERRINPITIALMIFGLIFFIVGVRLFLYD